MNINDNFDLRKHRDFLLSESRINERFADRMSDVNPLTGEKERVIYENDFEVERLGIFDDIDEDLLQGDYEEREDRLEYLNAIIKYCTKQMEDVGNDNGELEDIDSSDEEVPLEEMAKLTGAGGVFTTLGKRAADIIQNNPELEKSALLKALNSDPEIAKILDASEEELHQNQTNKFAALVRGSRELGQRGRKADPNKPAAEPKAKSEKPAKPTSQKLKITNPKADEKPVNTSVFGGGEADAEDIADEMAARKAAKGNKRLDDVTTQLAQVTKEMKALVPAYQAAKGTAKEAAIVAQLKDLTAEKKSLEAKVYKAPKTQTAADLMGGEEIEEGFFGKLMTGIGMASITPKALKGDKEAQNKLLQFFSKMSPEKQQSFIQYFKDEYVNKDNVPFNQQLIAIQMIAKIQDLMGGEEI